MLNKTVEAIHFNVFSMRFFPKNVCFYILYLLCIVLTMSLCCLTLGSQPLFSSVYFTGRTLYMG